MGLLDDLFGIFFSPRREYGTHSTTKLGVRVRSRAEQRVADYFDSIGLRYEYERELECGLWIFTQKVSCPDFYLPDYAVYVEYWGMLHVDNEYDRSKYTREMKYKMARYHDLGVKFISLYPENMKNLDWIFRKKFEEVTGKSLPGKVSSRKVLKPGLRRTAGKLDCVIEQASPVCPKCGKPMVLRTAKRGPSAGGNFWGCSAYPACKITREC